jgi:hypothetical protein
MAGVLEQCSHLQWMQDEWCLVGRAALAAVQLMGERERRARVAEIIQEARKEPWFGHPSHDRMSRQFNCECRVNARTKDPLRLLEGFDANSLAELEDRAGAPTVGG